MCIRDSTYVPLRDKYVPGGEMWVTESGDAGGGGDTWASTYLDVFRTLNELGGFATVTNGVIFHNTLASSDYGFLAREVFDPRPNYFAVLLWNRLMGTTVFDTKEEIREGAHVFAHSRKDGKDGVCLLYTSPEIGGIRVVKGNLRHLASVAPVVFSSLFTGIFFYRIVVDRQFAVLCERPHKCKE